MSVLDLVTRSRSYRRFHQAEPIPGTTLAEFVELARLSPSGGNFQPLRFLLSCDPQRNALIFPTLSWAGHLTGWGGPQEGERPAAYIVILGDQTRKAPSGYGVDHGIAAQSILLGATERGLGGVIIGAIRRESLATVLKLPASFEILLVIALGRPAETVALEPLPPSGKTAYWRDEQDHHHVPKRSRDDLIIP